MTDKPYRHAPEYDFKELGRMLEFTEKYLKKDQNMSNDFISKTVREEVERQLYIIQKKWVDVHCNHADYMLKLDKKVDQMDTQLQKLRNHPCKCDDDDDQDDDQDDSQPNQSDSLSQREIELVAKLQHFYDIMCDSIRFAPNERISALISDMSNIFDDYIYIPEDYPCAQNQTNNKLIP